MKISEIFKSIQGEGNSVGTPALFIRTFGCNLRCKWCDSKYSYEEPPTELSTEELSAKIKRAGLERIVITGGEPLLQIDALLELFRFLPNMTIVEIETNGTIDPQPLLNCDKPLIFFNVSPKLQNSGVEFKDRINFEILSKFAELSQSIFKFVVEDEKDIVEIGMIQRGAKIQNHQIYLMPQARTVDEYIEKAKWTVSKCLEMGWNFSPREHLVIWGGERGK